MVDSIWGLRRGFNEAAGSYIMSLGVFTLNQLFVGLGWDWGSSSCQLFLLDSHADTLKDLENL